MDFTEIIKHITPEIYQALKYAIEIGKWPDGRALTQEQKELSMQAVIRYEHQQQVNEFDKVGYIDRGHKAEGEVCGDKPALLKWS
ncbi:DUF1315 family protein [bacterium AH-315-K03]|nr:DUF1315 family protein [bacterium AH-315-K03]